MLAGAFAVLLGMILFGEFGRRFRGFKEVDPQGATQLINRHDAAVIDVSAESEYEKGHIVDARNMPAARLAGHEKQLARLKDQPVLLYCRNGQASMRACQTLKRMGLTQVHWLRGGLTAWRGANLPVATGRKPKSRD